MSFPIISEGTLNTLLDEGLLVSGDRQEHLFNLSTSLFLSNPDIVGFIQTDIMSGIGEDHWFEDRVYVDAVYCCVLILYAFSLCHKDLYVKSSTIQTVYKQLKTNQNAFCNRILLRDIDEQIRDLIDIFCSRYDAKEMRSEILFIKISARMVYEIIKMS